MIEQELLNYGVLGLWTLSLLYDSWKYRKEIKKIIANNTRALNKFEGVIQKCRKK